MTKINILLACGAVFFICGCNKTPKPNSEFELVVVTNSSARIYEINKVTGGGVMISGTEFTPIKPSEGSIADTNSYLIDWGSLKLSNQQTNSLEFKLKTKWKDGILHYILTVSPYEDFLKIQFSAALSAAKSNNETVAAFDKLYPSSTPTVATPPAAGEPEVDLFFYDADGFEVNVLRVGLSEMTLGADSSGTKLLSLNGILICSREDYQSFKSWGAGWQGFQSPP